ncbi:MAG: GyrI-like domain-containing protein [Bacteroidota bacterium]
MKPRIEQLKMKTLIGINLSMSLTSDRTAQLWGMFGPRIKEISNRISADRISMQFYPDDYFKQFDPKAQFEKWALVEVDHLGTPPNGLKSFTLEGGLYAVFDYKGSSSDRSVYQFIFGEWIPRSKYQVDQRPHFEVLGSKYKNDDPNSEEEIWIPIKEK